MSLNLKSALKASLEDDEPIQGTDGAHEEEAPKSADAIIQEDGVEIGVSPVVDAEELIAAAVRGEEVATELDAVADNAEAAADIEEAIDQAEEEEDLVSSEMVAAQINDLLDSQGLSQVGVSFESKGDRKGELKLLAEKSRSKAKMVRRVNAARMRVSVEHQINNTKLMTSMEELAERLPQGSMHQFIQERREARATLESLNFLASEASRMSTSELANEATVQAHGIALESIVGRYGVTVERASFESAGDAKEGHGKIAEVASLYAERMASGLVASNEAFPMSSIMAHFGDIGKRVTVLNKERARARVNAPVLNEGSVIVNHLGVFKFLTLDNQQVKDVVGALAENSRHIQQMFDMADKLHARTRQYADQVRKAPLESDEDAQKLITLLKSSENVTKELQSLNGMKLLGNRTLEVTENSGSSKDAGEHNVGYGVWYNEDKVKPTNKAAWWARLPSTVGGLWAGGKAGAFAANLVFGSSISAVSLVGGPAVTVYGLVKGAKAGANAANLVSSATKAHTKLSGADLVKIADQCADLGRRILEEASGVRNAYAQYEALNKEFSAKIKSAGLSKETVKQLREAMDILYAALEAEWTVYELASDQTEETIKHVIILLDKVNNGAEKMAKLKDKKDKSSSTDENPVNLHVHV